MKSTLNILKEQVNNYYLIKRLSLYELKSRNKSNYLGMAWELINPLIQILIYWFVFGNIMQRGMVEVKDQEVSYIAWLIGGYVLWIFFYQSLIQGSKSIYSRLGMLSKMKFPMSIIPTFVIVSQLYIHLVMVLITIIILQFMGYHINIYYLQIIYFCFGTFLLVFALSLITSTLSTIVRDVHMLLNAILRMFLYVSPVLWPISKFLNHSETLVTIMKINPLFYLIEGYKSALFGTGWYFIEHWQYTIYFWCLVFVLLLIGTKLHMKFRRHLVDYL